MPRLHAIAHNPITDPRLQAWGWEIPVYLFLAGWVAGILVLCGNALRRGRRPRGDGPSFALSSSGLFLLALVALSVGLLALFLDLTRKPYVWRLSPLSWGAWILALVYPVLAAGVLLDPPRTLFAMAPALGSLSRRLDRHPHARRRLGMLAMVAGVLLGIDTGVLLSALGERPLWSSALLGPLFLVSGLSTGAAFAHLVSPVHEERVALARADDHFLRAELALIALLLIGLTTSTRANAEAAALLLGGPYSAVFWVGVVGLGIMLPLFVQDLALRYQVAHSPVAPMMVLLGGLALRFVIVYAGQLSRWPRS